MIANLFRKRKNTNHAQTIYDTLVQAARNPTFYAHRNVPDTLDGRFDCVLLHLFIVLHRLKGEDTKELGQEIFDVFIKDMEGSLRQMGVGYQRVPQRMKEIGEAFYGRINAYDAAISAQHDDGQDKNSQLTAMADAIKRNLYSDKASQEDATFMAQYTLSSIEAFANTDLGILLQAELPFVSPTGSNET